MECRAAAAGSTEGGEEGEVEVGPGGEVGIGDGSGGTAGVEHGSDLEHAFGMIEAGELGFRVGGGDGFFESVDAPVEVGEDGLVGITDLAGASGGEALRALVLMVEAAVAVEEAVLDEAGDGGVEGAGGVLAGGGGALAPRHGWMMRLGRGRQVKEELTLPALVASSRDVNKVVVFGGRPGRRLL